MHLQAVARPQLVDEERRHLAVRDPRDREHDLRSVTGGGDRVRPRRRVAVGCRESHVEMLARKVPPRPIGDLEQDPRRRRRLAADLDDVGCMPGLRGSARSVTSPTSSALPSRDPPCRWYPFCSRKPGSSSDSSSSPRIHLALFQKYRCGTSRRAGPPCSGSRGLPPLELEGDPGLAAAEILKGARSSCSRRSCAPSRTRPRCRHRRAACRSRRPASACRASTSA